MDIAHKLILWAAGQPRTAGAQLVLQAAAEIQELRKYLPDYTGGSMVAHMSFQELEEKVLQWAMDRKIIPNSNPSAQLMKTMSELGELADATLKRDDDGIMDGVGDVLVTLILYCELQGTSASRCLKRAYDEIKDRKGTLTPEGIFVKEGVR